MKTGPVPMPPEHVRSARVQICLLPSERDALERWCAAQGPGTSKSTVVRELLLRALAGEGVQL